MKTLIGMPLITQPNLIGEKIKETPKTITFKVTDLDFTPKTSRSGKCTHKFDKGQRDHLKDHFTGQIRKFWKETGREIGGSLFIPHHEIALS